jgi:hypothetical protein
VAQQHAGLGPERWATFPLDRQILMIGNELNRAGKLFAPADRERLRDSLERVLALTDLTVAVHERPTLRRELLRWRDLIGALYVASEPSVAAFRAAFRCLLQFTRASAEQIPLLLERREGGGGVRSSGPGAPLP